MSNYPRTKGCAWEKLDLSMKNEIFPIGYGDDLKYEEKEFMNFGLGRLQARHLS